MQEGFNDGPASTKGWILVNTERAGTPSEGFGGFLPDTIY